MPTAPTTTAYQIMWKIMFTMIGLVLVGAAGMGILLASVLLSTNLL